MPNTKMSLSRDGFADFKLVLRELCPTLRSAHADEALARGFGHHTYASISAAFGAATGTLPVELDPAALSDRLRDLGYDPTSMELSQLFRRYAERQHERIWDDIRSLAIRPANDNT